LRPGEKEGCKDRWNEVPGHEEAEGRAGLVTAFGNMLKTPHAESKRPTRKKHGDLQMRHGLWGDFNKGKRVLQERDYTVRGRGEKGKRDKERGGTHAGWGRKKRLKGRRGTRTMSTKGRKSRMACAFRRGKAFRVRTLRKDGWDVKQASRAMQKRK